MRVVSFEIEDRPPFRLDLTVWALRRRPHNRIDRWDGTGDTRTLLADGLPVQVMVREEPGGSPGPVRIAVVLRRRGEALSEAAAAEVRSTVDGLLGLAVDPGGSYELAACDERLAGPAQRFLVLRRECLRGARQRGGLPAALPRRRYPPPRSPRRRVRAGGGASWRKRGLPRSRPSSCGRAGGATPARVQPGDGTDHRRDRPAGCLGGARPRRPRTHRPRQPHVGARDNLRRSFDLPASAGYDEVAALVRSWWPYGGLVYFHLLLDGLARAGHLHATADQPGAAQASPPRKGTGE